MALTLKAMEYYVTAVRHGNIAKAADELNIAASAVGTAIDQVEHAFDLTLITRQRSRGIQANANGLAVALRCEHLLEEYRGLLTEGADLKHKLGGTLRIGYYAPIAPAFLPQILCKILPPDADVELQLDECDNDSAQQGLIDGTYDVILFVSDDVRPNVAFDVLLEASPYCLVSEAHPFASRDSVSIKDVAKEPLIVLNRPVAAAYYNGLFTAQDQGMQVRGLASSTEMVRSMVASGMGCAILNMRPSTATSYAGADVVCVPLSDPLPPLSLSIGYDKVRARRIVTAFAAACRAHFAGENGRRYSVE
ncbi:LysR family transcriptional regulator [Pontivivens insulae]|uniref:Hydrogen peroxide-inducible genes activator n=1 Tax=Pontivivens insulae TaxID=1639689 RepID=A0A2R8A8X6_9RHOB|nr:LysR family transcriptional regulator [Pontivivens insulae]RED18778.1 LysR family transcriptional regulator [Pontivivens insulae]SPF28676.1 Hydrogen peroxide-inducible genes activator [Pontivivens insulae]